MTFHSAMGLFIALFLASIFVGFVQFWILVEMTEQVNLKRCKGRKLDPFVLSLRRTPQRTVVREYRLLYPNGRLLRFRAIAIGTTMLCAIGLAVLLFGVLPRWALPSR